MDAQCICSTVGQLWGDNHDYNTVSLALGHLQSLVCTLPVHVLMYSYYMVSCLMYFKGQLSYGLNPNVISCSQIIQ
jgi:hypothetical protein